MKRSRLNPISKKRQQQIKDELPIRIKLCERCGGTWIYTSSFSHGYCRGGRCELCHQKGDFRGLTPHEQVFRSHNGKLSLSNSKMLCGTCHDSKHGIVDK